MNRHERRKAKKFENKAQHFVAKGYTKAWCDPGRAQREEPYVWIFGPDGPTQERPGRRRAPKNLFAEPDMYTIRHDDDPDARDLRLENGLGKIEAAFCAVRRDFIEPCRPLGARERAVLLAFAACSQFRTPGFREHTRSQWQPVLDMCREMEEQMHTAKPEQKARTAGGSSGSSDRIKSMTMQQVRAIVDKPLQTTLASNVCVTAELLAKMTNLTILCTAKTPGFITSDEPVVWFDSNSYKRPPMLQGPALMYDTVEITMPISPTRMLYLGRRNADWPEYMDLDAQDLNESILNDLNRRTCRHAREKVVVSRNEFRPIWAEPGTPPPDAWRADDEDRNENAP